MTPETDLTPEPLRRRWIGPAAAAVAVLLTASVAAIVLAPPGSDSASSADAANSPTPPADAAGPLIAMADLLEATPADATRGAYHYTHIELWARADTEIIGFLTESWQLQNGSKNEFTKRLPGQSARTFDMAQIGVRSVFDKVTAEPSFLSAAEVESFLERHGPPPGNPTELGRIIDSQNGGTPLTVPCPPACDLTIRPMVFFDAITSLYRETYLDRDARAALLRLIAGQRGVTFHGEVVDRSGRSAIRVAANEGGVRFSLLFDRNTGVLLASERGVPGFVLDSYSLYLTSDQRDYTWPTANTPVPHPVSTFGM
jgi:hypothetical protein